MKTVPMFEDFINEKKIKLFHSTTTPIFGDFKMRGGAGYGAYFAKDKKVSMTFGDIIYKVTLNPKNTLVFNDNEVKGTGFFNMTKEKYEEYLSKGYDSLQWNRKGKLQEFIALKPEIILDKEFVA